MHEHGFSEICQLCNSILGFVAFSILIVAMEIKNVFRKVEEKC